MEDRQGPTRPRQDEHALFVSRTGREERTSPPGLGTPLARTRGEAVGRGLPPDPRGAPCPFPLAAQGWKSGIEEGARVFARSDRGGAAAPRRHARLAFASHTRDRGSPPRPA